MKDWVRDALCGSGAPGIDPRDFQVPLQGTSQNKAKVICAACPVQRTCLKWALEHREIWGVWGGLDEGEIRKALSVNADGKFLQRHRPPGCPQPGCRARTSALEVVTVGRRSGLRCTQCSFEWFARTSTIAVVRHLKRQQRVRARAATAKLGAQDRERTSAPLDVQSRLPGARPLDADLAPLVATAEPPFDELDA